MLIVFFHLHGISQISPSKTFYPLVKKSEIKNYTLKQGHHNVSFKMDDASTWDIHLSIPDIQADSTYPLVIALHWAGAADAYLQYSSCLAFPAFDQVGAITVAPSGSGLHWIEPLNEQRVIDLVQKLKKFWPVDEDQIVITGYSNGGIGSWHYAKRYPRLFSAAMPMAGYYDAAKLKIPVCLIHGLEDELFKIKEVQKAVKRSIEMESDITPHYLKGYSHFMGCGYANKLREIALKLLTNE